MTRWTQEDIDRFEQKKCKLTIEKSVTFQADKQNNCKNTIPKIPVIPPQNSGKAGNSLFALGRMKAGKMNKTEAMYAARLEALKHAGEVLWYQFEPMNLRLADKCFYAVDFLVMLKSGQLECHEVKGGYITDDSLVKIKAAAEKFPFRFVMKQLVKGEWREREF